MPVLCSWVQSCRNLSPQAADSQFARSSCRSELVAARQLHGIRSWCHTTTAAGEPCVGVAQHMVVLTEKAKFVFLTFFISVA